MNSVFLTFHLANGKLCAVKNLVEEDLSKVYHNECLANPFPWKKSHFESSLTSSHLCVGVYSDDQALIGHGVFSLAAGEAELLNIAVIPGYQGQGIAREFLSAMCDYLQEFAREIFLEVRENNIRAISVYEHTGFNCVGERPNYYPGSLNGKQSRETALIYARSLRI
ncbi:ribosomal protein S18-alanine N-acetyltransferase [Teredinibacter sp. KSP-S5-2]|uniref:ribosomal protein S18-alanine N-acetyltransferase n=1 Tax=Teredinibacter sp. KSP-S5-2 TaxID=3034506 RepID=UPI00293461E4|nr:ribosomal protein S18-alanine N-acetyltransferase [Teredinibacter sp. KSP-S5-2]WNO08099.1 ribosomal protein S18-alanine N-acetyltransferase [Teredinibacter sp. KSP-S5-2]